MQVHVVGLEAQFLVFNTRQVGGLEAYLELKYLRWSSLQKQVTTESR